MKTKIKNLFKYLSEKSIKIDTKINLDIYINGLGSIKNSTTSQITFFDNLKNTKDNISKTKSIGCFVRKEYANHLPKTCYPIIVDDPYLSFAYTTNFFSNLLNSDFLDNDIILKNNSILRSNVTIKDTSLIGSNCVIGPNVTIDSSTTISNNVVISNSIIGKNCFIKPGSIIGGSGFGFTIKDKIEIVHIGNVLIGDNVKIGSNVCIDRAAIDSTIISNNVRIDNLVQIAHGVKIGNGSIIAAQTGIAGGAEIGINCIMGGQVGIAGHIKISDNVTIAAKSGVTKNISKDSTIAGFPAIDINLWKKKLINRRKNNK